MSQSDRSIQDRYAVDLFDPKTWYRSVFGEGTASTSVGIGGDSGLSPHPDDRPDRCDYTGRGPKGYRRPDERIKEDISEALTRHPDIDASGLEVDVDRGVAILRGQANDRWQKYLCEEVAASIPGVQDVRSEIHLKHKRSLFAPFPGYHWV